MALTESTMLPLGTKLPEFALTDVVSGGMVESEEMRGQPLVVAFICAHCPYVKHINKGLATFAADYADEPLNIIAISSNDAGSHPDDAPEGLRDQAFTHGFLFPYLQDETQEVAKAFQAACTPEFYLFDSDLSLVYRGQFDSSRPGNGIAVTGEDLRKAVDALLAGQPISSEQKPGIGCNIKWR